ncbi:MAG: class I SAM-dependent methyltransferase [Clostridiales Family XIII bacterium]|jgi:tRNA (adenine22-N1)-methyltransferase|nr:class I SAM-dependent methyltransferase [Clostridiales Family XIII bacterium]
MNASGNPAGSGRALSGRLEQICAHVAAGERVADIGTDHGFLPIALYERGIAYSSVLCDLKPGPLEKAADNIRRRLPGAHFDLRLGDGLSPLRAGEADIVVIAGMGGRLIVKILAADPRLSRSMKKYILQPRNAADVLRGWLLENGFRICDESLAAEGRFICEILVASPCTASCTAKNGACAAEASDSPQERILAESGLHLEISPMLLRKKDPLLADWLRRKIGIEEKILRCLENAETEKEGKRKTARDRCAAFRALLETEKC